MFEEKKNAIVEENNTQSGNMEICFNSMKKKGNKHKHTLHYRTFI